uniref:uncharacterized protein LOC122589683 n=1 Tax=Erigeron canadensis TaxID=72917 RepID=UPI001CB8B513|nr:uncharacterized protein LOC122589683 [Erigeron canadensis]
MKTVSGTAVSAKPVNLSKANILLKFVISDNGAAQAVSAYLRRASMAFNEHVYFKKHYKLEKNRSKEETLTVSDISHINCEENEGMVIGNGGRANMKFDRDPVQIDSNEFVKEKSEEKKKKMKRKRNVEVDGGVIVSSVMPKKKKN